MEKIVVQNNENERIDKYLASMTEYSRSFWQDLLKKEAIFVNGNAVKSSYKVQLDDEITYEMPDVEPINAEPENIPLDILYEDDDIVVINKPKGMVVHPAPGNYSGTLVNALLYHFQELSNVNGDERPGIVHRIDKDTSGCLLVCKNNIAHANLAKQIEDKTCFRTYDAVVVGDIEHDDGLINAPIGRDPRDRQRMCVIEKNGKSAITHFHVKERFGDYTYVECRLETGRTHQIRVHMKYINHPVLGDDKYGKACPFMDTQGQVLHASKIEFDHPTTGKRMSFEAPLPDYFEEVLEYLRNSTIDE